MINVFEINYCKQAGNPKPKFVESTGSFTVIFPLKEPIGGYKVKETHELTSRQLEILKLLQKSQLNSVQLAEKLSTSPAVRTVQVDLLQLEKMGLVKREGKARAMVWVLVK